MVNVKFCDRATKNVKNKIRFIFLCFYMFISFLLCCAGKRKEMNQRKEKPALYKRDFKTQKQKFPSTLKMPNSVR